MATTWSDCVRNPDTDVCKQACGASNGDAPTLPGFTKPACNDLYATYCADPANRLRPICACNLPWSSYPGSDLVAAAFPNYKEPLCWFSNCKSTGYYRGAPASLCPKCIQSLDITIGANVSQGDIDSISQQCSVTASSNTPTATPLASASAAPPTTTTPAPSGPLAWIRADPWIAVTVAAAIVLLVVLIVALA